MAEARFFEGPMYYARHDLWEAQIEQFGSDIPWLHEGIPPEVIGNPHSGARTRLDKWVLDELVAWSNRTAPRLPAETTERIFEDYQLTREERVAVRGLVLTQARQAFTPGIETINQVQAPVPWVAARAGETYDLDAWAERSRRAKQFAASFAGSGTNVLGLVRRYLMVDAKEHLSPFDPTKLITDEHTGISTITPLPDIVAAAAEAVDTIAGTELERTVCVAREAQPAGMQSTFYDAIWDAYTTAVRRYIYPHRAPITVECFPPQEPDTNVRTSMLQLARTHRILR